MQGGASIVSVPLQPSNRAQALERRLTATCSRPPARPPALPRKAISADQMQKGFARLADALDDTLLDVPDAVVRAPRGGARRPGGVDFV
jgi:hypothetical protein